VPWWVPAGSLVVGIVAMVWFVKWERVAKNPIMPSALVMHRSIGPSVAVSGLLGVTIFSVDTYVPLYVQGGRGWSAGAAAAAVTPVMLAWSLIALVSMPLMLKWGFRALVTIGSAVVLASLGALVVASVMGAPLWLITVLMFLTGAGISPVSMGTLLAAQDAATAEQRGLVTSSVTFLRNFGGAMGVGMFGALFNFLTARSLGEIMGKGFSAGDLLDPLKLKGFREAHAEILARAQSTISWGLYWVFGGMALMAVVMVVMSRMISSHQHHVATREEMLEAAAG
jgi:hypothetical protein